MKIKKILFIAFFCCVSLSLLAQWNTNGTHIYNSNSGNVGINTTTPIGKLDINSAGGQLRLSGGTVAGGVWTNNGDILYLADWNTGTKGFNINMTSGNVGIGISNPSTKLSFGTSIQSRMLSLYDSPSDWYGLGIQSYMMRLQVGNANARIAFYAGDNSELMTINGSGNVGIGNPSPQWKLDVTGLISANGQAFVNVGTTEISIGDVAGGDGLRDKLYFHTRDQKRMTVDENGNVGIGTLTPYAHSRIHVKAPSSSPWGIMAEAFSNDKVIGISHDGINGIVAASSFGSGFTPLQLWTSNTPRLTVAVDGSVGIGTTSPNQKLTVNGTIYGKEVKVDLNVPGPDYVFEKDYKLPSLDEIKSYIDQHKHLPEVPSAKEMEQNGINLSEMNVMLLKKVEELTLHIIDQKMELTSQKEELTTRKTETDRQALIIKNLEYRLEQLEKK